MDKRTKNVLTTAILGVAWGVATAFGARVLLNYETSPGDIGNVPVTWPGGAAIDLARDRPTLVMIAHPQCPCTVASMDELAELVAHIHGKVHAYVLFYTPRTVRADWESTHLREIASRIPEVTVLSDVDGVEARRFGAETSGHTFLFATDGRLLFNGGITASRGHSGGNTGESAIVSLVNNQAGAPNHTFVFGCSLKSPVQGKGGFTCLK